MYDGSSFKGKLMLSGRHNVNLVLSDGRIVTIKKAKVEGVVLHRPAQQLLNTVKEALTKLKPNKKDEGVVDSRERAIDDLDSPPESKSAIDPGERAEAGFLSPLGGPVIHFLSGMSSIRVHDLVDLRANTLRWLSGPHVAMKIKIFENDDSALALEPMLWKGWRYGSHSYGVNLRYTAILSNAWLHFSGGIFDERLRASFDWDGNDVTWLAAPRTFWLASLEGRYDQDRSTASIYGVRVPLSVNVDWLLSDSSLIRTGFQTTPSDLFTRYGYRFVASGVYVIALGDHGRLGLGALLLGGEYIPNFKDRELDAAADALEDKINSPHSMISPLPWLEFWLAL